MDDPRQKRLLEFADWVAKHVKGDEKSEAQVFLDRLLQGLGHAGVKEVGATLEMRVRSRHCLWPYVVTSCNADLSARRPRPKLTAVKDPAAQAWQPVQSVAHSCPATNRIDQTLRNNPRHPGHRP